MKVRRSNRDEIEVKVIKHFFSRWYHFTISVSIPKMVEEGNVGVFRLSGKSANELEAYRSVVNYLIRMFKKELDLYDTLYSER